VGASNGAPIDWNNDGSIQPHVSADINNDNLKTLLTTRDDWATLELPYQCGANVGATTRLPSAVQCSVLSASGSVMSAQPAARAASRSRKPRGAR
jgi:hypothetical protein